MIPQFPTKNMSIADQKVLCDWRDNYGQPVVQVTVRNKKKSLYSYTRPPPTLQPLSFSIFHDISAPRQHGLNSKRQCTVFLPNCFGHKPSITGITGRSVIYTPFYLGIAADDIYQDQHIEILPKLNIYPPRTKYFSF